jgi:hypothetical protein
LRQQRSLEEIKQRGIPIKAFISTSFNVPEECIETSDIVFNKCWSFTVASVTFNYEGEIKNKSFNIRETLYTSYKNAYAMTQEIKIILTLKRKNMIPNIKSSEGIGDGVLKSYYAGAQSLSCSACFRKPSTYTRSNHQSEKL